MPNTLTRALVVVTLSLGLTATLVPAQAAPPVGATSAVTAQAAAAKSPAVPSGLPAGIEPMGAGMYAATCNPGAKPGATKLAKLLTSTYPGTSAGIGRACTTDTKINSEHMEGRAIDWMDSVRIPKEKKQAEAVLKWLFATDAAGHTYANARRLGVMYIIWNNKIWGAYSADQGWRNYNNCASTPAKSLDSACHRNHIHISLTWAGATGATSFWSKKVAGPNYGSCRAKDLNVAANYTKVNPNRCISYRKVTAPAGSSVFVDAS